MSQPNEIIWGPGIPRPAEWDRMYAEARLKGLWFFCQYKAIWWSPDELEVEQLRGNFRWLAKNFKLRHPAEREMQLIDELHEKNVELSMFRVRMGRSALAKARGESQ